MSLLHLWEDVKQNEWIDIPAGWLQSSTVFGGLVAGLLMQKHAPIFKIQIKDY